MPWNIPSDFAATNAVAALLVALGCGLLVGIERERRKGQGPQRGFAGVRTFAVASLAGAAAGLTQTTGLVVAGALLVAGLSLLAYQRGRSDDPWVTTELALLLAAHHAVALAALASVFVSSTATIASLGLAVRKEPADGALALSSPRTEGPGGGDEDRMFSLPGVAVVVHLLQRWLGDAGLLAGVLLAALADLHAAMAAVFSAAPPAAGSAAVWSVALALLLHAGSKSLTAALTGGWPYLRALSPGLWLHTLVVSAGIVWLSA